MKIHLHFIRGHHSSFSQTPGHRAFNMAPSERLRWSAGIFAVFFAMMRLRQAELMDDPGLDPEEHRNALDGLSTINRWSDSVKIVWQPIHRLARAAGPITVLDLATGGGDVPLGLWAKARRRGLPMQIDGCDSSPVAVAHARNAAHREQADVRFFHADVMRDPMPEGYDVILTSLFVHHLDPEYVVVLLRSMARAARKMIVVNDLIRCPAALGLAYLGTRLMSRSEVVHIDGPRSVRAAFTMPEIGKLAKRAGLTGFSVGARFPYRYLLTWSRT
jgi:SAM-dependent methyltransferase